MDDPLDSILEKWFNQSLLSKSPTYKLVVGLVSLLQEGEITQEQFDEALDKYIPKGDV